MGLHDYINIDNRQRTKGNKTRIVFKINFNMRKLMGVLFVLVVVIYARNYLSLENLPPVNMTKIIFCSSYIVLLVYTQYPIYLVISYRWI